MAAKIALVFLAAFVLFQIFSTPSDATIIRRDAPSTTEKNDIQESWDSFKQGLEDLVKKIESSDLYQNTTKVVSEFGQKLKVKGDELVQKIKQNADSKDTPAHN